MHGVGSIPAVDVTAIDVLPVALRTLSIVATIRRDLRSIGGLPTLLALLRAPEAGLRWRAADVLGTSAQNNSPVQQVRCLLSG